MDSDCHIKLSKAGVEKYVADSYLRGDITLREAAKVLDIPARKPYGFFYFMSGAGTTGSFGHAPVEVNFLISMPLINSEGVITVDKRGDEFVPKL